MIRLRPSSGSAGDLRLADQPALTAAVATRRPVLPVYMLDEQSPGAWALGGAVALVAAPQPRFARRRACAARGAG